MTAGQAAKPLHPLLALLAPLESSLQPVARSTEPKTAIPHRPKRTTMTKGAALPLTMGKASPHSQTAFIGGRHLCHRQAPTCREHPGPLLHAPFVLRTDPGHLARRRQHCPSTGPSTASSRSADSNPVSAIRRGAQHVDRNKCRRGRHVHPEGPARSCG